MDNLLVEPKDEPTMCHCLYGILLSLGVQCKQGKFYRLLLNSMLIEVMKDLLYFFFMNIESKKHFSEFTIIRNIPIPQFKCM